MVKLSILFTLFRAHIQGSIMETGTALAAAGAVIAALGVIFHFQGRSVIGPESSFMYSSPEWASYGWQIALAGAVIATAGIIIAWRS